MTDPLDGVFAALADPTRRAILARLATGEAPAGELAAAFPISPQAVSKHLNVLEAAGLITRTRQAQWRHCRIVADPLRSVADWAAQYRRLWDERYDTLGDYLTEIQNRTDPVPGRQDGTGKQDRTEMQDRIREQQ